MKACLLLQRKFAYTGHKLAIALKEKYGIKDFCSLVCVRSSFEFLKKQKDIEYSSLLLDEDIHNQYKKEVLNLEYLKNIEKEYGIPNLWPYITMDRVLMFGLLKREYPYNNPPYNHEEMMRILQVTFKSIINFLDKEKPDFIFITVINTVSAILLYQIAKKRNIQVFLGMETRIDDGLLLTDDYKNFSWVDKKFEILQENKKDSSKIKESREYIKKFREKPNTYFFVNKDLIQTSSLKELGWFVSRNILKSFNWFLKSTYHYLIKKKWLDYAEENPLTFIIDRTKRKIRTLIGYKRFYSEVNLNEEFAFFPLHLEPEMSTLLFAPFWTDQINLIKQIAKSLPIDFKLYVKEHPAMVRFRPFSYYRELKKIPNVKLINPDQNSFELIKNSKLVTVITGTAGWEATILKKPVITFGDIFYNKLSMVKKSREIEQLPYLIKEQLEDFKYNEKELENFIGIMIEESAPVGLPELWWAGGGDPNEEQNRINLLASLLANKLNLNLIDNKTI